MASTKTLIPISFQQISQIDLCDYKQYFDFQPEFKEYINAHPGQEHYKLLAYLSTQFKGAVCDVGTFVGASAAALSYNTDIHVVSYDVQDWFPKDMSVVTPKSLTNITFKIQSGHDDIDSICNSDLIVLDMDPHDGVQEFHFVMSLIFKNYRGVVLLDDIHVNEGMEEFWKRIPNFIKKVDLTYVGHHSGTGLLIFDPTYIDVQLA